MKKHILFIIVVCILSPLIFLQVKHNLYVQNLSPLAKEIYDFQKDGLSSDFTQVLKRHFKMGENQENVSSYLSGMGFSVYNIENKKLFNSNTYESCITGVLMMNNGWSSFFLLDEMRIGMCFNNKKLEKFSGTKFTVSL